MVTLTAILPTLGYVALGLIVLTGLAWTVRRRPRVADGTENTMPGPAVVTGGKPPAPTPPNPLVDKTMRKLIERELRKSGMPLDSHMRLVSARIQGGPFGDTRLQGSAFDDDTALAERVISVWKAVQQAQQTGDLQQARGFVSDRLLAEWAAGSSAIPSLPAPGRLIMKMRHQSLESSARSMAVEVGGGAPGAQASPSLPVLWLVFTRDADSSAWVLDRLSATAPESTAA